MSKIHDLNQLGQSIWLDYIRRSFIASGQLKELIDLGVSGMTSNPTIFEKAIAQSDDYDSDLRKLAEEGKTAEEIFLSLAIDDIRLAADLLRSTYDRTEGKDGYVSLEVNPHLAKNSEGTLAEAQRLWSLVDRPNLMIKIPATLEGLPAITAATAAGINVNVTLIFSITRYREVMAAFISGLQQRLSKGLPVNRLASVASFFVSRVDSKIDKLLETIVRQEEPRSELAARLPGKTAIANARLAYAAFRETFEGTEFTHLLLNGAQLQRPLWASTSTKNSAYSDILYVQDLIGANTVNTTPQETLERFLDHGEIRLTIEDDLDQAKALFSGLSTLGISIDKVTQELEEEGVTLFSNSYDQLIHSIEVKRQEIDKSFSTSKLPINRNISKAFNEMERKRIIPRIWELDHTVWKPSPVEISNRLGWLHIAEEMSANLPVLESFKREIKDAGYTHALLLGMGGSSLAPDLFSRTFKSNAGLQLLICDSTNPCAVRSFTERLDPAHTLFMVSTKSGTSEETLSFFKFFYNWAAEKLGEDQAREHFIAITDPGSHLAEIAMDYGFRATFLSNPDIGGRFSALSYYGLIPAALCGVDVARLLRSALQMAKDCAATVLPPDNPAARLGVTLAENAKSGRDKVTFILSPSLAAFGDWVEQLIAESTGKEGKGILPVAGEAALDPGSYGTDRIFVQIQLAEDTQLFSRLNSLEKAGFPVLKFQLKDIYDLGGQFLLWELATALAGYRLGINPFDQPNVEATKRRAREFVAAYKSTGALSKETPALQKEGVDVFTNLFGEKSIDNPARALEVFLEQAREGDYVSLQAFLQPLSETDQALQSLRRHIQEKFHLATTTGYGPRFLHSTGQLHKGDRGNGRFIQFTAGTPQDLPIPDEAGSPASSLTFGVLIQAQALGDRQALLDAGRSVIRFHFHGEPAKAINELNRLLA